MSTWTRSTSMGLLFIVLAMGRTTGADLADALDTLRAVGPRRRWK